MFTSLILDTSLAVSPSGILHPMLYSQGKKRSIAPKQTRRILLLVLEVPADDQKLKEQKADGKKPYFFLTDYKHLPKLWVE